MPTTHTLNFEADDFEKERIAKASRGSWDASLDLAMLNISYDEQQQGWVKLTEPEDSIKALKKDAASSPKRSTRQLFRVWDEPNGAFVDDSTCYIGLDGTVWRGGAIQDASRYVVERSTGQLDKHGQEVYIGDIILCQYKWWGQAAQDIYLVKLDEYGRILPFHHIFIYGNDLWITVFGSSKIEVIGNMHQHPQMEIQKDGWHSANGAPLYV